MPSKIPCPDIPSLQQLLRGQVPLPDGEALYDHLSECDRCAEYARTYRIEDVLTAAVRGAAELPEDPSVVGLIAELTRLAPPERPDDDLKATALSDTMAPFGEADGTNRELFDFLAPALGPGELGRLGPYRILKVLGSGGMGVVFHAEDPALQRPIAVKAMLPRMAASASARLRFLREGRAAASLHHDHIVPIYQVGEDRGVPFLAMPLLRGESLEDRLKREGALPPAEVCRIGREIAEGLAAAHARGLVHRDVKPANVWLECEGESAKPMSGRVKILDFGLARPAADALLTQEGAIVGTPAFMAPEQAGGRPVDARTDLFSLGCVLYHMATGELPFRGADAVATLLAVAGEHPRPPAEVNPFVPAPLSELVMRLLAKDPADRPASALEVVEQLTRPEVEAALPTQPHTGREWRRWVRRSLALLGLAAVAAGLIGPLLRLHDAASVRGTADSATSANAEVIQEKLLDTPGDSRPPDMDKSNQHTTPSLIPLEQSQAPLHDTWQVVAQMSSPRLVEAQFGRDYRAVAVRLPYVYAMNAKSFVAGDLVVFKLPAERPKPDAPLLRIEDCHLVEDAGDGGDLCVIGDALFCTHLGGLKVFSLEDPARPRFIKRVGPTPLPRLSSSIIRHGGLACLVGETGNITPASHLSVFDVSKPAEPRHISLSLIKRRVWCGCSSGDQIYLGALKMWEGECNGVAAFDLTNPEAPREVGFVETEAPYHVFAAPPGKRLVAVTGGQMQAISLADPVKPALLGSAVPIEEGGGLGGRGAAFVASGRDERLVCLRHVYAVQEMAFREVYRFNCWGVGSGFPHHGHGQNGYVAIPTQRDVLVLWSASFENKK